MLDIVRGAFTIGARALAVDATGQTVRSTGFWARQRDVVALREAARLKVEQILGRPL